MNRSQCWLNATVARPLETLLIASGGNQSGNKEQNTDWQTKEVERKEGLGEQRKKKWNWEEPDKPCNRRALVPLSKDRPMSVNLSRHVHRDAGQNQECKNLQHSGLTNNIRTVVVVLERGNA